MFGRLLYACYRFFLARPVRWLFFQDLIQHTNNFGQSKWMGKPIWQNIFDLRIIQEVIAEVRPALIIECGTNRGGSSLFYANLLDLMGQGKIVTMDIEKLHDIQHPRVTYLIGSSTAAEQVEKVRAMVAEANGPILVILDSDHSEAHVRQELDCYAGFVTPGSYCLVQDSVIDTLACFRPARPGPLPAIRDFLKTHPEFELRAEKSRQYLISHHPEGWLYRKA